MVATIGSTSDACPERIFLINILRKGHWADRRDCIGARFGIIGGQYVMNNLFIDLIKATKPR